MVRHWDVAVVGGGLAGLIAATEAARSGARVVLLEARAELGGRARSDEHAGILHNVGPHALYRRGAAAHHLRRLGIGFAGSSPSATSARLREGRDVLRLPGRGSRSASARLLARALRSPRDASLARTTFDDWLDAQTDDERARSLLGALARLNTYVDDPAHLSAGAAIAQLRSGLVGGVLYLHGGWASLVTSARSRALGAGVEIRATSAAGRVAAEGAGWVVDTGAGPVPCTAVVIAAGGPAVACRLLGLAPERWAGPRVEASVLDVVVDAPPTPRLLIGVDRPLYLSTHAPPARLGDGGALVSAMRYLRPGAEVPAPATIRAELVEHLALAGIDVGGAHHTRYLHRLTVCHRAPDAARGGLPARPDVAVEGCAGAFVAGDWVGPEGMLADAAVASGVRAGRAAALAAHSAQSPGPGARDRRPSSLVR